MANEDSVLREVDQELAEERQWSIFRKYGAAVIGASAALVLGVGAWQIYSAMQTRAANEHALEFNAALDRLETSPEEGRAALKQIADEGASGYSVLSEFRRAASLLATGERRAAIGVFEEIYAKSSAPRSIKDMARIRAAYLALDDGRDAALSHLGPIQTNGGAFGAYADEVEGIAALKEEDYETAVAIFTRLSNDPQIPEAVRARAEEYAALATAGKSGVNLTGAVRLDDILGAVGADGEGVDFSVEGMSSVEEDAAPGDTGEIDDGGEAEPDADASESDASEADAPVADEAANETPNDESSN